MLISNFLGEVFFLINVTYLDAKRILIKFHNKFIFILFWLHTVDLQVCEFIAVQLPLQRSPHFWSRKVGGGGDFEERGHDLTSLVVERWKWQISKWEWPFPLLTSNSFFAVALTFEDLLFMSPFRLQISVNFVFRFIYHYRYYKFQRNYVPLSLIYNKILLQHIIIIK